MWIEKQLVATLSVIRFLRTTRVILQFRKFVVKSRDMDPSEISDEHDLLSNISTDSFENWFLEKCSRRNDLNEEPSPVCIR